MTTLSTSIALTRPWVTPVVRPTFLTSVPGSSDVAQHVISAFTRVFDALVSAFTRVFDALGGRCTARPGHKIAKTTPCKVEWAPGSQHSCCAASGAREEKWSVVTAPNLSHPALGLTLLERHLRRALQKILAEIFQ